MKENISKKRILLLFLIAVIIVTSFVCILSLLTPGNSSAKPVNGVLDMKNWDAEGDEILSLIGEWDFYWNRFVTYQDIVNNDVVPDLKINAPSVWNDYKIDDKNLPGYGYGTYRLKMVNMPIGQPMAFRLPAFATSYELYINDSLLAHDGETGKDKEHSAPGCKPQLAEFTPAVQSVELIIHVSNFINAQGGMSFPIKLGRLEKIQNMNRAIADQGLFLFGGLAIMAFYFMSNFLLRRNDRFSLYFGIACILYAGSTAISGDLIIYRLIPNISYDMIVKIMYINICCLSVSIVFSFGEMFPKEISMKVLSVAFVYAASMTLLILLTPISFYSQLFYFVIAVQYLIDLYFVAALVLATIRRRKDAFFMLIGSVGVMVFYMHGLLFNSGADRLASLIALLAMSFALAKRLTEADRNENDLSQKLLTLDQIKDETIIKAMSAEAAFMQAQIKPHFLYNTLNTISSLCNTDPLQAGRLIDEFSEYLRQSFDFTSLEMFVSLEQELSLVKSYIEIEKMRFGDELSVRIDIDDIIELRIPVLSMQPLVENAVNHGLRKKSGGGSVTLSVHRAVDAVMVSVEDDGHGIAEDKLKTLLLPDDGKGIGLWNIDKRLKKIYGKGLIIESAIGKGTTVSYMIPDMYLRGLRSEQPDQRRRIE